MINHIFFISQVIRSAIFILWNQDEARNIKKGNWERQMARNDKLVHFFQK